MKGKRLTTAVIILVLLLGIMIMAYPSLSNYVNTYRQSQSISAYAENVSRLQEEEYKELLEDAETYNREIAKSGILWKMSEQQTDDYREQLSIDSSGIMGYVNIPKINLMLPIYHGTDDSVLETSIGHLAGTSLPVGGNSTHCVLSGHRGLPSAKLFSDLDKLSEGDTFTITVLNRTLTYEVDQIRVVLPDDVSDLAIEEGKDYCTLLTCTPYGVNTHRLLVRGHRIPNGNGDADVISDAIQIRPEFTAVFIAVPILAFLLTVLMITTSRKYREKHFGLEERYLEQHHLQKP